MMDIQTSFEKKTELLCKGLYLDKNLIDHYKAEGIEIDYGRKGGAGPLGGRYFLFDNQIMVNTALWDNPKRTNLILKENKDEFFEIYDTRNQKTFCKLKLIKNPQYYDPEYKTSDGVSMKKIALVHGRDCLASTIYQKCVYWACGEACKFCGIELSLQSGDTILEKNHHQMVEVIAAAKNEGRCSHMTLTSGTDDKGTERYIEILIGIKEKYPNLPLHVQIEPLHDLTYLNRLQEAGADIIGIHIEVLDKNIREIITPGKSNIPYELFEENWKHALDIFGKNQVASYILTGFGESSDDLVLDLEKIISIGVIPYITPVRSIPGRNDLPITNPEILKSIYSRTANLLKKYGVNPLKNKAGCVRCGGCSAINEAYRAL